MNKIIKTILILGALILPQVTHAAFGANWQATSTGWITPGLINGNLPIPTAHRFFASFFTATSSDTASVFPLANILKLVNLTGNGFVKTSGGDGTLSVDTTTYESGLTAGDGLTRTSNDFDCDTASGSVFGCLASADWTTFNNKQAGDATLTAFAAYNTNGLLTQTAADTFTGRTITGTADRITLTNGNGVSGNPTIDIASTYVGQSTITTLGTITTGVWNGTAIANANLANSTISGIALGNNLANLTATDSTLTFSGTYNGGTARTIGLNLGNANTWTALQTFGNASSSALSTAYASSTIWRGGGLEVDCDGDAQTLGWDITLGQFTCGDDDSGGVGSSPGGSDTHVQFNDASTFGGDAGFTYNKTADRATLTYASTTAISSGNIHGSGDLVLGNAAVPQILGSERLFITDADGNDSDFGYVVGQTGFPVWYGASSGGDPTSPTVSTSNQIFLKINAYGYDGDQFLEAARQEFHGNGTLGNNDMPGGIRWGVTADGATSPTNQMFLINSGFLGIGTSSPHQRLTVNGNAYIAGFITATSTATSTFQGPILDKTEKSITFNITAVTSSGDFGRIWKTPRAITITRVIVNQEGATNVVGQLQECDGNGANCTGIDSADITGTDGVDVEDDGTLSNPSVDQNDYIGWTTTSVSGTNTRMSVTFRYKENF